MIADSEPSHGREVVTDSELWRIDQVCDGFETAWKSARRPQIEGFLEGTAGASRWLLLRELVLLDVQYRRRRGESPDVAEYRHRFPELDGTWLETELTADLRDDTVAGDGDHGAGSSREEKGAVGIYVKAPGAVVLTIPSGEKC